MNGSEPGHYVLGHGPEELARLERQSAIFEDATRSMLRRAGIGPGNRVLDIGCGAGDVSMLVAGIVGPTGEVIGVDRAREAVATARQRAAAQGMTNVRIVECDFEALECGMVDAVVGRFVLMHQRDPAATLAHLAKHVQPRGVLAFMESHLDALAREWSGWPASAAYGELIDMMLKMIKAAGGHTGMGLRLRSSFLDAKLPDPVLDVHCTLAGRDAASMCRYMADSVRSMSAAVQRYGGGAPPSAETIDLLERRMLDDFSRPGAVINGPMVVTAWVRLP